MSFDTAEQEYQLQKRLGHIQIDLLRIRSLSGTISDLELLKIRTLSGISGRELKQDLQNTAEMGLINRINIVMTRLDYILLSMQKTWGLEDKISDLNRRTAPGRALLTVQEIQAQIKSIREMDAKRGRDVEHQLGQVEAKTNELEDKADEEARNLLENEGKQEETFEDAYIAYSVLGCLLYTIGWALGLLGTWHGIEGGKAEG